MFLFLEVCVFEQEETEVWMSKMRQGMIEFDTMKHTGVRATSASTKYLCL